MLTFLIGFGLGVYVMYRLGRVGVLRNIWRLVSGYGGTARSFVDAAVYSKAEAADFPPEDRVVKVVVKLNNYYQGHCYVDCYETWASGNEKKKRRRLGKVRADAIKEWMARDLVHINTRLKVVLSDYRQVGAEITRGGKARFALSADGRWTGRVINPDEEAEEPTHD